VPGRCREVENRWYPPQSDGELMAEKQILSFKPAPRLEQIGYKHSERVQDRKHRSQGCDDSALQCESRSDGIFGRDRRLWLSELDLKRPLALKKLLLGSAAVSDRCA